MKLTEPKQVTFLIAVVLAAIAFLGVIFKVAFLTPYNFWILLVAFVILMLGVLLKDF